MKSFCCWWCEFTIQYLLPRFELSGTQTYPDYSVYIKYHSLHLNCTPFLLSKFYVPSTEVTLVTSGETTCKDVHNHMQKRGTLLVTVLLTCELIL